MTAKLYYFDGRGKAELTRLTLAAAGVEFTEEFSRDRETFLRWVDEGLMPFRQLPVLDIDGKRLAQTGAIVRYLGRRGDLWGQNEDEALLVDMYLEAGRDFFMASLPILTREPEEVVLKRCKETVLRHLLPVFEKRAMVNGNNGYLVGSKLTLADLSVVEGLLVYVEYLGKEVLNNYPALQKFFHTVTHEPRIAAYLNGPQRKKKNNARYVKEVSDSLAWK